LDPSIEQKNTSSNYRFLRMTDSRVVAVISDDEEDEQQEEEEVDEVGEEDVEEPDWLPDGWSMEVYRTDDATINKVLICSFSSIT
jgi:hypothetical protein